MKNLAKSQAKLDKERLRGNQRAVQSFMKWVAPHQTELYRIALSYTRSRAEASDLVQDALLRAFTAIETFDGRINALPWLARILRNIFIDRTRSAHNRREMLGIDDDIGASSHPPDGPEGVLISLEHSRTPFTDLALGELQGELDTALDAISEEHRSLCILCDVIGLSYQEAADINSMPIGTVRSRLARARRALRNQIIKQRGERFSTESVEPLTTEARREGDRQ